MIRIKLYIALATAAAAGLAVGIYFNTIYAGGAGAVIGFAAARVATIAIEKIRDK